MSVAIDLLWSEIVERAEALHDASVATQRTASPASARKIEALAMDIATLARTRSILASRRKRT